MKIFVFTAIIVMISIAASAQSSSEYVTWKYSVKKIGDIYEIRMDAAITAGWHIYAQGSDAGPIPTKFTFNPNPSVTLIDYRPKEIGKLIKPNKKFYNVKYYERTVAFVQKVRLKEDGAATVSGNIQFMVSSGTQGLSPSKVTFSIGVGK